VLTNLRPYSCTCLPDSPDKTSLTRRQWLVNSARLLLLRWRVIRGRALPVFAMGILRTFDRWAAELALGKPWTPEASARLDRVLSKQERDR